MHKTREYNANGKNKKASVCTRNAQKTRNTTHVPGKFTPDYRNVTAIVRVAILPGGDKSEKANSSSRSRCKK